MRRGTGLAARLTAAAAVGALALPLAACAPATSGTAPDLIRAGCPENIRIQTDDLPYVEWGFLYALLDPDELRVSPGASSVSAPLLVDGASTGVRLTIFAGDPLDGVSGNVALYDDETLLLAAVDTDRAILDAVQYPTVGLFAPTLRDSRMIFWDAVVYPRVRSIEQLGDTLTARGDRLVPIIAAPNDPFRDFLVGEGQLGVDQVEPTYRGGIQQFQDAGGVSAQQGDLLIEPYLLAQREPVRRVEPHAVASQTLDDAGYTRDSGVLSARPQAVVRYADCFEHLIPILQRSLASYLDDPDVTTELLVALSAQLGDPAYTAEIAAAGFDIMLSRRIAGNGFDDTIGELDVNRLRSLLDEVVPMWLEAGLAVPSGVEPEDVLSNQFIDFSVGR